MYICGSVPFVYVFGFLQNQHHIKISPLYILMCKWNAAIIIMYNMYALGLPAAGKLSPGRGFRRCRKRPAQPENFVMC